MSWGLVPSWSKDRSGAARMINARVESVADKPAFRAAYAKRRCLVPADGWYEWQVIDGPKGRAKQPMYMTPADGHELAFAGLYEFWRSDAGTLSTCTIITTPSVGCSVRCTTGCRSCWLGTRGRAGSIRRSVTRRTFCRPGTRRTARA